MRGKDARHKVLAKTVPYPLKMTALSDLSAAQREWLLFQRARPCKHGHPRHDARVYRNLNGSLWLDCAQCVRDRVNAYRRRMEGLEFQAR